jgi:hypothetical protein
MHICYSLSLLAVYYSQLNFSVKFDLNHKYTCLNVHIQLRRANNKEQGNY